MSRSAPVRAPRGATGKVWKVGERAYVRYQGHRLIHERLFLWPVRPREWAVLTPDNDLYVEDYEDGDVEYAELRADYLRDLDSGVAGVGPAYSFADAVSDNALNQNVVRGKKEAHRVAREKGTGVIERWPEAVDWYGSSVDVDAVSSARVARIGYRFPAPTLPTLDASGAAPAAADHAWLVAEHFGPHPFGTEVEIQGRDYVFDHDHGIVNRGGRRARVERVSIAEVSEFVRKGRERVGRRGGDGGADDGADRLRERLGRDAPNGRGDTEAAEEKTDDCRTLFIDFDEQGERFKRWRAVVNESSESTFADFPLDGPLTCLFFSKHAERHGGDPRQWLMNWTREKKLEPTDRVVHEMRVLTDALHFAGVYDQLNVGSLCCLEILARRIQLIQDAYANPAKPSWEAARLFSGMSTADEGIAPALKARVAKKAKDESDVVTARLRARDARGGPSAASSAAAAATGEAVAPGGLPGGGGKQPGGKGRQRGLAPAPSP